MKVTRKKEVRETSIRKSDDVIHIETDGCIVNIRPGLYREIPGEEGMRYPSQKVTSVEIIPDGRDQCDTAYYWQIEDSFPEKPHYASVRVVRVIK